MADNPHQLVPQDNARNVPSTYSPEYAARALGGGRFAANQDGSETDAVPWTRYFAALKRYWWLIVLVWLLGSAGGYVLTRRIDPQFQTRATIWVNVPPRQQAGPIQQGQVFTTVGLLSILESPIVTDSVVLKLKLNFIYPRAAAPLFTNIEHADAFRSGSYRLTIDSAGRRYTLVASPGAPTQASEEGAVGDSIGRAFGLRWQPSPDLLTPKREVNFSVQTIRTASDMLTARLDPRLNEDDGQFIQLIFRGIDPQKDALTLNTWADQFIYTATEIKRSQYVEQGRVLSQQVQAAEQQFESVSNRLESFQRQTAALPSEAQAPVSNSELMRLQAELTGVRQDRRELQMILADSARGIDVLRFNRTPGVLTATGPLQNAITRLQTLEADRAGELRFYTPTHPRVTTLDSAIARVRRSEIPHIVRSIVANLASQDSVLAQRIEAISGDLQQIPARSRTLNNLNREYVQSEEVLTRLRMASETARLADQQTISDLKLLSRAQPPLFPESNSGSRLFILAVLASFGAGVAIALLLDRLDRHFRYPDQATMELGLTIAGSVPKFRMNRKGELSVTSMSQVVESFRTLRLGVRYHFPLDEPVVVCVSSPGAGEGKSLVSSNLGVAFANAGHKTLVIDGDVRRGVVHSTFDTPRRPGLVDYLAGTSTADAIIKATSTENLFVIPSGSRSRNAPEFLVSDRMGELVAAMRQRFEVVIIDSPPFAAGMDAFALGTAAGRMLVVLRPGVSDRKLAAMKLDVLDRLPVTVIGAVINGISANGAYRYYSDYADYGGDEADKDESVDEPDNAKESSKRRLIART